MLRARKLRLVYLFTTTAAIALAQTPVVAPNGVVDAASFREPAAFGSLISIFGSDLAASTDPAGTIPLPKELGGVSVAFNGITAPLLYVSPSQINAQLPWELVGAQSINVVVTRDGIPSAPVEVHAGIYSPAVYAANGQAAVVNLDGTLASAASGGRPATPGSTVLIFASGLGPVNPVAVTGSNSLDQIRNADTTPTVSIGGTQATVTFAGLSPEFVGVYQLNIVVPPAGAPTDSAALKIQIGGATSTVNAGLAIGAGWPQWGQNARHSGSIGVAGQDLSNILADIIYDPLVPDEQEAADGSLVVHYQVPLVDGNDVYMEFKAGTYDPDLFATQIWGEKKYSWQNSELVEMWSYESDWKAPGSSKDFWEPVFHAALANDAVYVPGASGSVVKLSAATGEVIARFSPFGTDPDTYETGPLTVDAGGNILYNAIQIVVNPGQSFYSNDVIDSWLVKITPTGNVSTVSYLALTSPEAPAPIDSCLTSFSTAQLPWPPSPTAVPGSAPCGKQRVGLNVAPAVGPDGTIYSVTRAQFNDSYGFLVAIQPDLTKKWVASLRDRFNDGCGVPVSEGGWLPPNGQPGGCTVGALTGVDPATNRPGAGRINDSSSSTPTVAPDGSILYGAYSRYNYTQGHMMRFDTNGNYLGAFGFGWDTTAAIYEHDGTWSIVMKNNHYGTGSYCGNQDFCPGDRTGTNPASPEAYFVTQFSPDFTPEWSFQNTNTQSCERQSDGSLVCEEDHPFGFEWCVNAAAVDSRGVVYANSEDGNLYAISQGGVATQQIFQQLALGAAYTPASVGGDGRVYSQNAGRLFISGR